jgi:hypothetical protein
MNKTACLLVPRTLSPALTSISLRATLTVTAPNQPSTRPQSRPARETTKHGLGMC